jgi:hypothetical protein
MAWTAPTTRATDDLINASIWNTDVVDNLAFLKNPTSGVATLTTQLTTTSTSFTDATGLSVTMTTSGGNVMCVFNASVGNNGASQNIFTLDVDGTDQGATDGLLSVTASAIAANASFVYVVTGLSAASHTIKVQWRVSGGTGTLFANNSSTNFKPALALYCVEMG